MVGGFVVLLVLVALIVNTVFGRPGGKDPAGTTVASHSLKTVNIPAGVNANEVGKILQREGIIDSIQEFVAEVKADGVDSKLKPGSYQLPEGGELADIIARLQTGGTPVGIRITLPEGLSIDQAAGRLEGGGAADAQEYQRLANRPADFTLPRVGGTVVTPKTLEGLLFPSTYFVQSDQGAKDLIRQQLATFESKTVDLPWDKAKALGIDPYEVVIVASLIEKEARVPEERARVASVIYNRLRKKMPLGIDATVRYAVGKWTGPLTKSDLDVASPYNTRRYKGLPPGPIASPGRATLEAALRPEKSSYLYYVLIDKDGHHFFTSSYDEFVKAKENAPDLR